MIHKIYYICNIYLMYTQYNRYIYIYVLRYTVSQIYSHPNFFSCGWPTDPANLKKTLFQRNYFFFKMLPCRSSGHPSGCEWLRVSANCRRGRPQLAARGRNLKKNTFPTKPLFFKMLPCHSSGHSSGCFTRNGHLRPLAAHTPVAIRSHSQPLAATRVAASGRFTDNGLAAKCSQPLRPFAATRSHSSGRKWPRVAAPPKWPQVAAPPKWPQVAAPDKSERVAASGREWPLSAKSISTLKATPCYICKKQLNTKLCNYAFKQY